MTDIPVVAVAFGTSTQACNTYAFWEKQFRKRYPDRELFWAFSSGIIREKLRQDTRAVKSLETVLGDLEALGYARAVIQSLHVIAGYEFEKTLAAARQAHIKTAMGMPLLASSDDCGKTVDALVQKIPDQQQWATVLVGHGTSHPAGSAYRMLERIVKAQYPENVFVSVVEGEPCWEEAYAAIRSSQIKKVKFIPLMFVAGEHMLHNVLGKTTDDRAVPWNRQLEGYEVDGSEPGLGFNDKVVDIYLQHTDEALSTLS
jgi:sirohydrochlorin cobaltochelatase